MTKMLVFDMDGTIADLYGVENWLADLRAENPRPYIEAKPLVDMDALNILLDAFRAQGWRIAVTTWLSKGATPAYDAEVRTAKIEWLARHGFTYDEIHLVKYGTTKANCTRKHGGFQVLVDDNDKVRAGWRMGSAIDAKQNIIEQLIDLLSTEV